MKKIWVIAPSSPFDRARFLIGKKQLNKMGFQVKTRPDIFSKNHYLAGTSDRRFKEFQEALYDPEVTHIMAARGGFGLSHLMPDLWELPPPPQKKMLIGFSDFTLAHRLALKWEWPSLYSPMIASPSFHNMTAPIKKSWLQALKQKPNSFSWKNKWASETKGTWHGRLVGGCLTLLAHSQGTPWAYKFNEPTILFIEDVGEEAYRIDRYFSQIENSTDLSKVQAILWGQFHQCSQFKIAFDNIVRRTSVPHLFGIPVGHGPKSQFLKLNEKVELNLKKNTCQLNYF